MNRPVRILYVDDSALDLELVRDVIDTCGEPFELTEAAARDQFETLLRAGEFDIVLSDFNILGFDGLQVIDAVKARDSRTPVVLVTGTGSEEIAVEAQELTDEQIGAVHEGLRLLAALDPDRASQRNEMGFNMFDGRIGHELAVLPRLSPKQAALGRRLLRKYRRQLAEGLLARIG